MTLTYKQKLKIFHDKFIEFSSEEISRYEKTGTGIFDIKSDFKPIIPSFVKHIPIIGIPAVSVEVSSHWHEPSLIERVNRAFNSINYNNQIKKLLSNAIREVAIDFEDKLDAIKDETEISKIISFAAIATYKLFSYLRENELGEKPLEKVIVEAIFQQSLWQTIWVGEDVFTRRLEGNERRYYKFVSEADIMDYVERGRKSAIPFSEYIRGMYSLHEDVQIVLHKDVSKENREKIDVSYGNLNGYDFDTSIPEIEIPRIKETVNVHALRLNDMEDKATKMALQFEYTMQVQREAQLQHQSIHSNDIYFCNVREAVANFIGREEQLEQIHEYFSKHGNIVQVIGGLGGIGKTQTVLQYIKYHEEEYGYRVRWFSAESKMTLDSEFREFAQILKIDVDKKSEQEILKLVKVKLASQIEKSLLIFDNVEDYEIIKEYLPSGGVKQHHIIITARNSKDYEDGASILGIKNIIKLEPFSPTEAVKYIKTTLPEAAESEALKLATLFDNVPLGLSQSVAYIKNNDIDIATYLDEYHRIRNEQNAALLEILHDPKYDPHISNIYITLSMTLDSLAYVPKAVKLLKLCSYLNSDNIPDYMFDSLFDNKIEKNRVIAVLKGYSLISVRLDSDTKFIHVHKIVQEAIRINIGDESVVVLQQAMELVHIQMVQDYDNRSSLKNYKSTLQHAISLIDHHHDIINIDFANTLDGVVAELHNDCGVLYRILGQWDNAETSYKSALQLYKKVYGEEHENISMVIDNLGVVYLHVGKIQIALDSFMESLRILKIIDIEDHQAIPEVLNNIGHAYLALKNTKLALENFQQAQIIFTRIYEEEHPFVAETILNIGIVYRDLGQYQISLNYLEQALRIYKIKYDDTVPAVVSTINQIAVVYGYLGKYQESLVKFEQVLAIRTIIFGENHPTIAEIINNIGATLYNLEKHSEALIFLDKALKLYQASYGKESYYSAIALGHIGAVHHKCERYQEALDYYTQALNICMDTFGDKHPEVARLTGNIGQVYFQLRKYEKALENYQQALEIYKEFYGEEHPEVATILDNIGQVYKDLEKYEDALSHFEQALIIRKAVYSDGKHFHIAMSMNNIGVSCYKLKRYQDAQNNYEQALVLYKSIYGDKHSDIATTLDNIGDVYEDSEQYQNALNYYEQALVIRKAIYGEKHTDVAKTINNIGAIHRNLEQYQEALENFLQVLEINRILHGDYHISVAIVLSDIGGTYKSLFMYEEALTQYEEALQIRRILYGNEHPSIIRALYDIGKVYYVLHKYNEALASYEEALPIVKHLHGDYDDLVVICLGYIGNMNSKLTRYQEALVNYQEALLTNEVIYGEDHLYSAEILEDIGDIYDKLNDYLNALVSYLKASKILLINDKDNDDLSVRIAEVYIEFGNSYVGKKNFSKAIDQYNHALSHCSEDNDNHSSLIGEASSLIEEVEEQIKIILISDTKKYFGEESADTLDNLLEDIEIKDLLADFETSGSRHVITTLLGIVEPLTITTTNSIEITANHDNIDIAQVVHDGSLPIVERISSSALLTSDEAIHKRDGCVPALDELPTDHTIQAINTNPNYQPNQYIILASFTAKEAIESASTVKYALKEILYLPLPELPTPLKNNYLWVGIHYTVCNIGMYSITGKIDLVAPLKLTTIYGARILTYEHLAEQKQLALQNNKDNKIDSASEFIQNCGLDMLAQSVLAVLGGVVTGTPVIYDIIIGSAVGGTQCYFIYNQASKPAHTYSMSEQTTAWAADLIVGGVVMSNMHFNFDNPKEKMTAVKQGFVILSSVVTTDYITKMFLVNYKDSCFEYIANTIDSTYKYFVGENEAPEL